MSQWRDIFFNERERKQIEFAKVYCRDFKHGAIGHNDMVIIAKLAELIDLKDKEIDDFRSKIGVDKDTESPLGEER